MRLAIVGTGYVGLVAAVCFAKLGHEVTAVDREPVIQGLAQGRLTVWEAELEALFEEARAAGRLSLSTDIVEAATRADALMLAVGTPAGEHGEADLQQIHSVLGKLVQAGVCPELLIVKSTVPVGACDELEASLQAAGIRTEVAYNPEFLRQGSAVRDFFRPDRIVLGCETLRAETLLRELYASFAAPVQVCDRRSAELIKYASNAFLATKISFANMLADLCEGYGADIREVTAGIGADRRIGPEFLQAGVGYGGSCFPKDLQALLAAGRLIGCRLPLLEATAQINDQRIPRLFAKLLSVWGSPIGKRIGILGISFKPHTNDIRDAPFLPFLASCEEHGIQVRAYDPVVRHIPSDPVLITDNPYAAVSHADAVVIMTDWPQLGQLDWPRIIRSMRLPLVIDGRNLLSDETVDRITAVSGAVYMPVGRPAQQRSASLMLQ